MPTHVRAPNGDLAVFPDGMSDGQIEAVMQREYPRPSSAVGQIQRGGLGSGVAINGDSVPPPPPGYTRDRVPPPPAGYTMDAPTRLPVFTIQAPDGRKIDIEAADEATAMRGAQEWAASNPAAVGHVTRGGMGSGVQIPTSTYDQGAALTHQGPLGPASAFAATLNRAIPFADEFSAGLGAGLDVLTGRSPDLGSAWKSERDRQAGMADQFQTEHPHAAALATGTGYAAQAIPALMTGGASLAADAPAVARAGTTVGRAAQAATRAARAAPGLATTGAAYSAANAAADQGTLDERLHAANAAVIPGALVGVGIPAAFGAARGIGKGVFTAAGRAVDPFAARVSRSAAERQAGARIDAAAPNARSAVSNDTGQMPALAQQPGDPAAVSHFLTSRFNDLDNQAAADVIAAQERARTAAGNLGGQGTPEGYGSTIRNHVQDAENAARGRERQLWQAVDPDGTLTGNVTATKEAAATIQAGMPNTARPMDGEESAIFTVARGMKPLSPVSDLIALRSRVSSAMRQELMTNGRSPSYARLAQLRGSIQDNIGSSIQDVVQSQSAAVAAGQLAPEKTFEANVRNWVGDWRQRTEARAAGAGGGASSAGGGAATLPDGASSLPRTAGSPRRSSGGAPSNPDLPGQPEQPTFDAGAAGRLASATDATRQRASTFGVSPVSNVTARAGASDLYRLPDGSVPGKFFHSGNRSFNDSQALIAANPQTVGPLSDYAALTLRREAMTPDGVIDPAKFARWQTKYSNALRALPDDVRAGFADAATASQTAADAAVARAQALREAQLGATGRVMRLTDPQDVTRAVGTIMGSPTGAGDLAQLARATRGDPAAFQGLRQAVADHLTGRFLNTQGGAKGDLAAYISANRNALGQVFSPAEMASLEAAAAARRGQANGLARMGHRTVLDIVGGAIGSTLSHGAGISHEVGALVGGAVMDRAQALRAQGVATVEDLINQAMLNPDLMRRLLARAPQAGSQAGTQAAMRGVIAALAAANGSQSTSGPRPKMPQAMP